MEWKVFLDACWERSLEDFILMCRQVSQSVFPPTFAAQMVAGKVFFFKFK